MNFSSIKLYFKKGFLIVLVPAIFLYLFSMIFRAVDGLWISLFYKILGFNLWPGVGFVATLILIVLLGWFMSLKFIENSRIFQFLKSLPKNMFFSSKADFFKNNEKVKPALVEYPCPGIYTFAFIVGEIIIDNKKFYKCFINTIPAVLTGYLFVAPEDRVKFLENSSLEIVRQIMSYGLPKIEVRILEN